MIEFKDSMTPKDYIEFGKFHSKNSESSKKWKIIMIASWPIMDAVNNTVNGRAFDGPFVFSFLIALILSIIFVPLLLNGLTRLSAKNVIRENEDSEMFMEKEYKIDESGIDVKSSVISSKYSWSSITKFSESSTFYYFYINTIEALIINKNCFDIEESEELKNYINLYS